MQTKMKVLIIGGSGFIGGHIARQLAQSGHEVVLLNRGQRVSLFDFGLETIKSNRSELVSRRAEIERRQFDLAIDTVAMNAADINGTVKALDGVVARIVLLSSGDVYRARDVVCRLDPSAIDNEPIKETSRLRGRLFPYKSTFEPGDDLYTVYDKIPVEAKLQELTRSEWTICRLPAVYGPGDEQHRLFYVVKRIQDGRTNMILHRDWANWRWTWGYVEDIASAVILAGASANAVNQIYNLGEAETPTFRQRFESIVQRMGSPLEILEMDEPELPSHGAMTGLNLKQHWQLDTSKIRSGLGYGESTTSREALDRTIAWELENPPQPIDAAEFEYAAEDAFLKTLGG